MLKIKIRYLSIFGAKIQIFERFSKKSQWKSPKFNFGAKFQISKKIKNETFSRSLNTVHYVSKYSF